MDGAIEKTLSFLLFILIGILLKKKISTEEQTNGLKSLVLSIALPATIFIALLKVEISSHLVLLPFLVIGFNSLLFLVTPILLSTIGIDSKSEKGRSAHLLIPSLAPGLSCFPFILEFLGETSLARAAMSDLGNKFFVLFVLYIIALKWYYRNAQFEVTSLKAKLKSLAKTLLYEPVNLFIIAALILVSFGIRLEQIPNYLSITLTRISYMMTPLVLMFIGLAVKIKRQLFIQLLSLLLLRAGFTLLLMTGFIYIVGIQGDKDILLMVAFSLSACSFWPFAHISAVHYKERKKEGQKTFDSNFALSILALSLPFSVLLILAILTAGDFFVKSERLFVLGAFLSFLGLIYPSLLKIKVSLKATRKGLKI